MLILLDEPNVLILDEPGNGMDTDMLARHRGAVGRMAGHAALVTHDRFLMERVTDHQFALVDGHIRHLPRGVDGIWRCRRRRALSQLRTPGARRAWRRMRARRTQLPAMAAAVRRRDPRAEKAHAQLREQDEHAARRDRAGAGRRGSRPAIRFRGAWQFRQIDDFPQAQMTSLTSMVEAAEALLGEGRKKRFLDRRRPRRFLRDLRGVES